MAGKAVEIDWISYGSLLLAGVCLTCFGLYARRQNWRESCSLPSVAVGLYVIYGTIIAIFNYLLLPVGPRLIDDVLIRTDAMMGFDWANYVNSFSNYPMLSRFLGYVYMSSLAQLLAVIIFLGVMGRVRELHTFLITGLVACTSTVLIWYAIPSIGPSGNFSIAPELAERLSMVVDPQYGMKARELALNGPKLISPRNDLGLVAFPSFHTGMAAMAVWFLFGFRYLFFAALALNGAMLPAILLHGGHYLSDVFGGICVFIISVMIARFVAGRYGATGNDLKKTQYGKTPCQNT